MVTVTMRELLEAGVHLGQQVSRWNPKMKEWIYGEREGIYIIDLQKTQRRFRDALGFVVNAIANDSERTVLFVGTKPEAQGVVREEAERAGQFYVNQRWQGGLLTNFQSALNSIKHLKDLEEIRADGRYEKLTKKERNKLDRELESLNKNLSGIKAMSRLPDLVFIIDVQQEEIAVAEANRLGIPIVAVVNTSGSPEGIDYLIPGNDDAEMPIRLFTSRIADAILEGQQIAAEPGPQAERIEEEFPSEGVEEEAASVAEPVPVTPQYIAKSNAEIRAWYLEEVSRIPDRNRLWQEIGMPARERALAAWVTRHVARLSARLMMADPNEVELLRQRDLSVYGNPDGPSFEYLVMRLTALGLKEHEIYRAIIEGSYRTNTGINRLLGL